MAIRCLNSEIGENFAAYHGDCVDVVRQLPDRSVDFSIYSPPFSGLYIYNDSEADMGNSSSDDEFLEHYQYLADELFRVMRPGRDVAVHCKDLVFYKNANGRAGLRDFPGMLIRAHEQAGFTYHSRITIRRCPVMEMTKTKAHGLLYKQLRADSSFSRQGLPEYIVVFRKWAMTEEEEASVVPVTKTKHDFPLEWWQNAADPVWMDMRVTDVLNASTDPRDERHICPMPLDITKRATLLWSNPGDVVLSPFMGIGSEGVASMKLRRKFIGVELKDSYFAQSCRHLRDIDAQGADLFEAA